MAKLTLNDLASLTNESAAIGTINANNTAIENALENTLSRDGTSPNTMGSSLDMNSNRVINLPLPQAPEEPIRKAEFDAVVLGEVPSVTVGTTTTLDPDEDATVVNSGTEYEIVLDFGIPRGVRADDTATLTNKTIDGDDNTLLNIANSALTNSSMTIAGHVVSLGGTQTLAIGDLNAISDGMIVGNISGSSAAPLSYTLSAFLDDAIGTSQGTIAVRGASSWEALPLGPSGFFLRSDGTTLDFEEIPGGGDLLSVNNLSDLDDASTAVDNLGATTVGKALFTATDATAARTTLDIDASLTPLRQNNALSWIYQAKTFGATRRGAKLWATGFKGASDTDYGIVTASSSNYTVTAGSAGAVTGNVAPNYGNGADQIPTMTGSTTSGVTISASTQTTSEEAWKVGDKSNATDWATASGNTTGWLKIDLGSAKLIAGYTLTPANVGGSGASFMPRTWTLQGSDTGSFSGEQATLDTRSSISFSGTTAQTFSVASPASYRYYRLNVTQNNGGANFLIIAELNLLLGVPNNMTIVTTAQTAASSVSKGRVLVEIDDSVSPTIGTDFTIELTCNGGTNWTAATTYSTATTGTNRKSIETEELTCTSGTSFQARIKTLNNKLIPVYGVTVTVS